MVLGIVTLIWVVSGDALAREPRPVREVRSENERYVLRVEMGRPTSSKARAARGTLLSRGETGSTERLWDRPLVNDVAPLHALVRDDGRFVITLDEYRRGGARHALVIYGPQGALLRHFTLPDLLQRSDWPHVRVDGSTVSWLDEAEFTFDDKSQQFVIRLNWDRTIRVDLLTMQLVPEGQDSANAAGAGIPANALVAIYDSDPAALAKRSGVTPSPPTAETPAAVGEEADDGAAEVEPPVVDPADSDAHQPDEAASDAEPDQPAKSPEPPEFESAGFQNIPAPNPDQPTDYVSWMNDQVRGESAPGASTYNEAVGLYQGWEGSADLIRAATKGDPAVLTNPDLKTWLDRNQIAIARFREAARAPHAGFEYHADKSGAAISVVLPHLSPIRNLARATIVAGKLHESKGEVNQAVDAYLDVTAAGAHASRGITLIENLVGIAMQSLGHKALLDAYAAPNADEIDYVSIARRMSSPQMALRPMKEAVAAEHAFALDMLQRVFKRDETSGRYVASGGMVGEVLAYMAAETDTEEDEVFRQAIGNVDYDVTLAELNTYYDGLSVAAELPYDQARELLADIESQVSGPDSNPVLRMFVPEFTRAYFVRARADTQERGAHLLTELRAYRQEHGAYPKSLDVFGDRDFVFDPLTGASFVYRRDGDDITLYSLGVDGIDSGGVHDKSGERSDYVIWPRPDDE